jgi:hypothetical protein
VGTLELLTGEVVVALVGVVVMTADIGALSSVEVGVGTFVDAAWGASASVAA